MEGGGKPDDKGKGIEANAMGKGREQRETRRETEGKEK